MPRSKMSNEWFIERARDVHGDRYDYSESIYEGSHKKIFIRCLEHGGFWQEAKSHLKGSGCPSCGVRSTNKNKIKPRKPRVNTREFISRSKKIHGRKYNYSETKYERSHKKVKILCKQHGPFWQSPNSHLSGQGCPKCAIERRTKIQKQDVKKFIEDSKTIHGDRYDYSKSVYVDSGSKIEIVCPVHGSFWQVPSSHKRGHGCPKCKSDACSERLYMNTADFLLKAKNVHGEQYDYSRVEYNGTYEKVNIICQKHGVFSMRPNSHLNGQGCRSCNSEFSVSTAEREIEQFISQELHLDTRTNDRLIIGPKELDIVVSSRSLAIEFNGLYWHNESQGKGRRYHIDKTEACEAAGYRLLHFFEDEWRDKPDRIKKMLTYALRPDKTTKYNARSLTVVHNVDRGAAREFLDANHLQGFKNSSIRIGLCEQNTGALVAYIGFSSRPEGYHIDRFATVGSVRGGFSRLLAAFEHKNRWKKIISFADRRYSQGRVYEKNGFVLEKVTPPGYDYTNGFERWNRQSMMKHKMKSMFPNFDPNLTEKQNAENNHYYRIWNCGMYKFVKENHMNLRIYQ